MKQKEGAEPGANLAPRQAAVNTDAGPLNEKGRDFQPRCWWNWVFTHFRKEVDLDLTARAEVNAKWVRT